MFVRIKRLLKLAFMPLTLFVVPHSSGKSLRIQLPSVGLLFILFLWISSSFLATFYAFDVYKYKQKKDELSFEVNKLKKIESRTEDKLIEVKTTLTSLKESNVELKRLLSFNSREDLLSNLPLSDPVDIDLDIVKEKAFKMTKSIKKIKEYLAKERDIFFATPLGWPVKGRITSSFGRRINPKTRKWGFHAAVDIGGNKTGTPIKATADGIVSYSGWRKAAGRVVIIEHGMGYQTVYAHNNQNLVKVGQIVNRGDVISTVGSSGRSTGPHVHYAILKNGKPVNPKRYLKKEVRKYVQKK